MNIFQVRSVLDSLEREYKRDEDWCASGEKGLQVPTLVGKHQEQKEAFLKACTLVRRTAETFLKYTNRSLQFHSYQASSAGSENKVKSERSMPDKEATCHPLFFHVCLCL